MKRLLPLVAVGMTIAWTALVCAQAVNSNPILNARRLYYLRNTGGATNVPTPFPTNVGGYTNRIGWETIEPSCAAAAGANPSNPTNACYNWTTFDGIMNAVPSNIKIAVGITTGIATPNWELNNLESDGFGTFASVWNKPFNGAGQNTTQWGNRTSIPAGEVYEFPIPWDTFYQADINSLAQALATHIAGAAYSSQVVRIEADVINSSTEENFLMGNQNQLSITVGVGSCAGSTICQGPCATMTSGQSCTLGQLDWQGTTGCAAGTGNCGSTGAMSWQTVLYTPTKVENAYKALLTSWVNAFPTVVVNSDFVSGDMPPLNNSSQGGVAYSYPSGCTVASNAQVDSCLVFNLINDGFAIDNYFAAQNNSGSNTPTTASKFYLPFARIGLTGMQTGAQIANNANYNTMLSEYIGCKGTAPNSCWNNGYIELYDADATDPNNVAIDGWASSVLQNPLYQGYLGPTPTPTPPPSVSQSQIMLPVR